MQRFNAGLFDLASSFVSTQCYLWFDCRLEGAEVAQLHALGRDLFLLKQITDFDGNFFFSLSAELPPQETSLAVCQRFAASGYNKLAQYTETCLYDDF